MGERVAIKSRRLAREKVQKMSRYVFTFTTQREVFEEYTVDAKTRMEALALLKTNDGPYFTGAEVNWSKGKLDFNDYDCEKEDETKKDSCRVQRVER